MIYTHTIGRIGKDCKTITGAHGTFIAVDMAVDDYSKGQNITTWVRVRSSRENHIRLAEYLTKGRLILVEGTISTSQWTDRQGESHTQISINADSIAFVNAGKKEEQETDPKKAAKKGAKAKNTPSHRRMLQSQTRKTYHSDKPLIPSVMEYHIVYAKFDGCKSFKAFDVNEGRQVGNLIYASLVENTEDTSTKLQKLADLNKECHLTLQLRRNGKVKFQTT